MLNWSLSVALYVGAKFFCVSIMLLIKSVNWNISANFSSDECKDITNRLDWILPITATVLLLVFTSWILISLTHFGIKTKKWRSIQSSNPDILSAGLVYGSVVLGAAFCLLRYSLSLVFMNVGFEENEHELCDTMADLSFTANVFVLLAVVFFLWFRQRIFYTNRMLNVNYGKPLKAFSSVLIILLLGIVLTITLLNTIPNNHYSSKCGCIYKPDENNRTSYWIPTTIAVIFGELALASLFIYPIKQSIMATSHTHATASHENTSTNGWLNSKEAEIELSTVETYRPSRAPTQSRQRNSSKVQTILTKTLTFAVMSILTNVFLQIFAHYVAEPSGHRRYPHLLSNLNALLNLLFLVFSFTQYREMLTSPCRSH